MVDSYTYLGIVMHRDGKYTHAMDTLASAGMRALFAMQMRCKDLCIWDYKLKCHLFNSLVQPVLSYGCEIWGPDFLSVKSTKADNVHNKFMKHLLGVKLGTPASIVLTELGRQPLAYFWKKLTQRFVARLATLPDSRLVKIAYREATANNTPWAEAVARYETHPDWSTCLRSLTESKAKFYLDHMLWDQDLDEVPGMQPYLISPSKATRSLSRFRTGSHCLRVETGRWSNTPREDRLCECCNLALVEDEHHFLFDCPFYCIIRGHFHCLFCSLDQKTLKSFWLANKDNMLVTAKYIHACLEARQHLLECRSTRSVEPRVAPYP